MYLCKQKKLKDNFDFFSSSYPTNYSFWILLTNNRSGQKKCSNYHSFFLWLLNIPNISPSIHNLFFSYILLLLSPLHPCFLDFNNFCSLSTALNLQDYLEPFLIWLFTLQPSLLMLFSSHINTAESISKFNSSFFSCFLACGPFYTFSDFNISISSALSSVTF